MKKIFTVSALALSMLALSSFSAFAACPGDDCDNFDPIITTGECIGGNCEPGWVATETNGTVWGDSNFTNPDTTWAAGCSELNIATMAGAPTVGEASILNLSSQAFEMSKVREDGTAGFQIQDVTNLALNTKALDGAVSGGAAFEQNRARFDTDIDLRQNGLTANMDGAVDMAGMLCVSPGTTGSLDSTMATNAFQVGGGDGYQVMQQMQTLGSIKIDAGYTPATTP